MMKKVTAGLFGFLLVVAMSFGGLLPVNSGWPPNVYGSNLIVDEYRDLVTDGLVSWWPFDEGSGANVADASGNGNNGTAIGSPSWEAGYPSGYAIHLNGSTQYVNFGDFSANTFDGVNQYLTVCARIKLDTVAPTYQVFVSKYSTLASPSQRTFYFMAVGAKLRIAAFKLGDNSNYAYTQSDNNVLSVGTHHRVCATMDLSASSNRGILYLDGSPVVASTEYPAGTPPTTFENGTTDVEVGRLMVDAGGVYYLDGAIRDVRLYNSILTAGEIASGN